MGAKKKLFVGFCVLIMHSACAQFVDVSSTLGIVLAGNTLQSGCGVSMVDFDQDGWDDLTVGQPMNAILAYRNVNGSYQLAHVFDNTGDPKSIQWVDYDNDGDLDFFHTVMNQTARLYRRDASDAFTEVTDSLHWPIANARTFGTSWGDYDKDGFLDLYVCNYNSIPSGPTNWLLHNTGQGGFENVTAIMGVGNGTRRSYQSSWVDFNLDGWLDLFVANDMNDRNEMFLNNQGVQFTPIGADFGMNTQMEGMSANFNDFDSDGDWDLLVSNNLSGNVFLLNEGDTMVDIADSAGVAVNSTCWGVLWMDYDHDGFDDLHISTSYLAVNNNQNYLFHNNGDSTFSDVSMPNDLQIVFASAKGDANNDGWWDFVEMKQYPAAVALWQNTGGNQHWLKFGLEGTVSNRDGIGAIIRYFYPGKSGMLTTHIGEGYLDQDSQYEIISLADYSVLDSLTITWPSGWVDRYTDLSADQFYHFTEGETFMVDVLNETGHGICSEYGQVVLSTSAVGSYHWSTDEATSSVIVSQPGVYWVEVTDASGVVATDTLMVDWAPVLNWTSTFVSPTCAGDADGCVAIQASNATVLWSDGGSNLQRCNLSSGAYSGILIDEIGCSYAFALMLEDPLPLTAWVTNDTVCFGETITPSYDVQGGVQPYASEVMGELSLEDLHAGEYVFRVTDAQGCMRESNFSIESFSEILFEIESDTVCPNATAQLSYTMAGVTEPVEIFWNDLVVDEVPPGDYVVALTDANGCSANASFIIATSPEMEIVFEVDSPAGGVNGQVTASVMGGTLPFSYQWNTGESGPVLLGAIQGVYALEVIDAIGCSVMDSVAVIDTQVEEYMERWTVFPNPMWNEVKLVVPEAGVLQVVDACGRMIYFGQFASGAQTLDVSTWSCGTYIAQFQCARATWRMKWLK
jgi:hypothetical protein